MWKKNICHFKSLKTARKIKQKYRKSDRFWYKFPVDFHCVECGGTGARQVSGEIVFPEVKKFHRSTYFVCPCGAYVLCHRGSGVPMGYPAGVATRAARGALHNKFLDPLWRGVSRGRRDLVRDKLYRYLARKMGLPFEKAHVSMFDLGQCHKAINILENVVKSRNMS